ncbi:MAG: ribonucleoside triphosphate reductase, partial [Clostridia bacterium]|nr:ribonucleoside triphosphate reductase [Clostridia bacterium]
DWKAAANLVRKIAENYKLPYYTMSPTYSVCRDHGYLTGEQTVCPICGEKTEVYSRITGYYRPIQNWNDGKAQEYKDRKVYDIGRSVLTHKGPIPAPVDEPLDTAPAKCGPESAGCEKAKEENGILLFKTPTCPNCKAAAALLDKAGISYTALNANEEKALVEQYGVKQAPTLIVPNAGGFDKFRGVSDIKGWLMNR